MFRTIFITDTTSPESWAAASVQCKRPIMGKYEFYPRDQTVVAPSSKNSHDMRDKTFAKIENTQIILIYVTSHEKKYNNNAYYIHTLISYIIRHSVFTSARRRRFEFRSDFESPQRRRRLPS